MNVCTVCCFKSFIRFFENIKNVQSELFEIFKMSKNDLKFTIATCWINSEISNRSNSTTLDILMLSLLLTIIILQLLKVFNDFTSWSHLKSTVQIHLALYPFDPFFINNLNVTANNVEKHCFVVLNVKLEVRIKFKTF